MKEFTIIVHGTFAMRVQGMAKDEDDMWDHVSTPEFLASIDTGAMELIPETLEVHDIVESGEA